VIAFFDLDRTLLSVNSATLWVMSERRLGFISTSQALRAAAWLFRYRLGMGSMEEALGTAIASLAGVREADLRDRSARFYASEVRPTFRPGGIEALRAHQARGDARVLLTSSSLYLSELVAAELALDGVVCTRFEVGPEGRLTGRSVGPPCFGAGKRAAALAYAESRGQSLGECTFYTDSFSDLPVLEAVGQPVVVHPDPRLRREAARRGWPVVDWGKAG